MDEDVEEEEVVGRVADGLFVAQESKSEKVSTSTTKKAAYRFIKSPISLKKQVM